MNEDFTIKLMPLVESLRFYHRHDVKGLHNIPSKGPAIVACTHSLATYDMLLLMVASFQQNQRFPRALIDRLFDRVPGVGRIMERLGCVTGAPENAKSILSNGDLLYVAPGGMEESLRSHKQRFQLRWQNRKGFARLAIETGSPVVLAACPGADLIYDVRDSALTRWAYKSFKIPLFFANGIGPTIIPKPVKLVHYLSEPIYPPVVTTQPSQQEIDDFHSLLTTKMAQLIARGKPLSIDTPLGRGIKSWFSDLHDNYNPPHGPEHSPGPEGHH